MFRLIRLAIYGILGYFFYEFVRGMMEEQESGGQGIGNDQGRGNRTLDRALDEGSTPENITGSREGERVVTGGLRGESVPHMVGRGVVSR
jgi:hypothetical protein